MHTKQATKQLGCLAQYPLQLHLRFPLLAIGLQPVDKWDLLPQTPLLWLRPKHQWLLDTSKLFGRSLHQLQRMQETRESFLSEVKSKNKKPDQRTRLFST